MHKTNDSCCAQTSSSSAQSSSKTNHTIRPKLTKSYKRNDNLLKINDCTVDHNANYTCFPEAYL